MRKASDIFGDCDINQLPTEPTSASAKSYLELKIVAVTNWELERLIGEYESVGFTYDGYYQEDGGLYWAYLRINNGLIDEAN